MSEQFENFQKGFDKMGDFGSRLAQPAVDASKVTVDSLSRLANDQAKLGRAWVETCNKQLQGVADADGVQAIFQDDGYAASYREAAESFGEAIRTNAEQTRDALAGIGRDAFNEWQSVAESMFNMFAEQGREVYQQATEKVEETVNKAA